MVPCFVIETSGDRIVVAVPGTQVLSEAGEWVIPGSTEGAQRTYSVNGVEAAFHRVDSTAFLRSQPAKVTEAWRNQEGTVREPDWKMLRKVYYGSEAEGLWTDTEIEESQLKELTLELARLRRENEFLKVTGQTGGASSSKDGGARALPPTPRDVPKFRINGDDDSEAEEFGSMSELSEREGGLGVLLKKFKETGGANGLAQRKAETRSPPRRHAQGDRADSPVRLAAAGEAIAARRAALLRGESPSRTIAPAALRAARPRVGAGRSAPQAGADEMDGVDVNQLIQLEIVKSLKQINRRSHSDTGDAEDLDGLRVMRSLGRMRALKSQLHNHPGRIIREYEQGWVAELGAAHKPWTWRDVATAIPWGKYRFMMRVYVMFGEIKALMERGEHLQAEAQLVQCMKATHEFGLKGNWKVAWPYTHLQDPCEKAAHAGTEVEAEAIIGMLRTREDLRKKGQTRDLVGDEEEEEAPRGGKHGKKA